MASEHKTAGGHFYIAQYGLRIQAAANTIIAWRPGDWHGTSLHNYCGIDSRAHPAYHQRGISFVTSARLKNIWLAYRSKAITHAAAVAALFPENGDIHGDDEDDDEGAGCIADHEYELEKPGKSPLSRKSKRKLAQKQASWHPYSIKHLESIHEAATPTPVDNPGLRRSSRYIQVTARARESGIRMFQGKFEPIPMFCSNDLKVPILELAKEHNL